MLDTHSARCLRLLLLAWLTVANVSQRARSASTELGELIASLRARTGNLTRFEPAFDPGGAASIPIDTSTVK